MAGGENRRHREEPRWPPLWPREEKVNRTLRHELQLRGLDSAELVDKLHAGPESRIVKSTTDSAMRIDCRLCRRCGRQYLLRIPPATRSRWTGNRYASRREDALGREVERKSRSINENEITTYIYKIYLYIYRWINPFIIPEGNFEWDISEEK